MCLLYYDVWIFHQLQYKLISIFLDFLQVDGTSGQCLFDVKELKNVGLDISDLRG